MTDSLAIRQSTAGDVGGIEAVYPLAFPDEELLPLVRDLLAAPDVMTSLVAAVDGDVVGHVVFTHCGIAGATSRAALLGPLAVTPSRHGCGIGSALVRAGLKLLEDAKVQSVFVLGDPAYYGRFGFEADPDVKAPYPMPAEWASAWQSMRLSDSAGPVRGTLSVPAQWRDPALWSE